MRGVVLEKRACVREDMAGPTGSIPFKHNFERIHQGRVLQSALQTRTCSRAPYAQGNPDRPNINIQIMPSHGHTSSQGSTSAKTFQFVLLRLELDSPGVAAATAAPLRLASPAASEPLMPLLQHKNFDLFTRPELLAAIHENS
jgi:hypothetical protein